LRNFFFFSHENWGVTPNFDKIVEKGITYEKFYSAGVRSIFGIQAILTGIPSLPNLPYMGRVLDAMNFRGMGYIVKKYGYKTIFVQSSKRRSYRLDSIAKASGFDYVFGMEDIKKEIGLLLDYPPGPPPPFGWDYETLVFLFRKIQSLENLFWQLFSQVQLMLALQIYQKISKNMNILKWDWEVTLILCFIRTGLWENL
jgi:hypothetical protein